MYLDYKYVKRYICVDTNGTECGKMKTVNLLCKVDGDVCFSFFLLLLNYYLYNFENEIKNVYITLSYPRK